ncbi:hypothetical protein N7463_008674 [Penicillium fimorum]|uniref:Uncharacterized protein n=1 Tax=Penicillium fimorum TaxID=1882269 RepID=A0A9X0C3H3_9EURO|nr:hypothetical protein N7463_008674 [Penicillium fimorum]
MPSRYNCSGPYSPISADNDITGPGIIANYVGTAVIAVLLIIIYFLVVYDPALDPFRKTDQDPLNESFRPNPIDTIILRTVRHIPNRLMGARKVYVNAQVKNGFIEGISSLHWMVIVDLAWFSSLTHLGCLTLLRNHLYNHSRQRMWRLLCMAALVILLTVALSFTGEYDWSSFEVQFSGNYVTLGIIDPAMCHLSCNPRATITYWGMIFSMLLIAFGFVARIVKMHKTISVDVWGKARAKLSMQARRLLSIAFSWCCLGSSPNCLKRTLIYRPLLTTLLIARLFLDWWSSMFFEESWLIFGFIWGTMRLFGVLSIIHTPKYVYYFTQDEVIRVTQNSDGDSDWGFGQVVALVLLLAPLITVIKYFTHDDKQSPGIVRSYRDETIYGPLQSIHLAPFPFTQGTSTRRDDFNPNSNWDDHAQILGAEILYFMLLCCFGLIYTSIFHFSSNLLYYLAEFYPFSVMALVGLWGVVFFFIGD